LKETFEFSAFSFNQKIENKDVILRGEEVSSFRLGVWFSSHRSRMIPMATESMNKSVIPFDMTIAGALRRAP
jgi:hypothetical protein